MCGDSREGSSSLFDEITAIFNNSGVIRTLALISVGLSIYGVYSAWQAYDDYAGYTECGGDDTDKNGLHTATVVLTIGYVGVMICSLVTVMANEDAIKRKHENVKDPLSLAETAASAIVSITSIVILGTALGFGSDPPSYTPGSSTVSLNTLTTALLGSIIISILTGTKAVVTTFILTSKQESNSNSQLVAGGSFICNLVAVIFLIVLICIHASRFNSTTCIVSINVSGQMQDPNDLQCGSISGVATCNGVALLTDCSATTNVPLACVLDGCEIAQSLWGVVSTPSLELDPDVPVSGTYDVRNNPYWKRLNYFQYSGTAIMCTSSFETVGANMWNVTTSID